MLKVSAKLFPRLAKLQGTESRIFRHKALGNFIWRHRFLIQPPSLIQPLIPVQLVSFGCWHLAPAALGRSLRLLGLWGSFRVLRTAEAEAQASNPGEGNEQYANGGLFFRQNYELP